MQMTDVWTMKFGVPAGLELELVAFVNWVTCKGSLYYKLPADEVKNILEITVLSVEFVPKDTDEVFMSIRSWSEENSIKVNRDNSFLYKKNSVQIC